MTIHVVDCSSMSTDLAGAEISKGAEVLGNTNASGQLDVELSDTETFVILRAKKHTYLDGSEMYSKDADDGATRTMCLDKSPYGDDDPTVPGQPGEPLTADGPCFIVTAATGSAQSEAVVQMRALRDRVRGVSMLGGQLIDSIYSEYEQFSPRIATEIDRDVLPRQVGVDSSWCCCFRRDPASRDRRFWRYWKAVGRPGTARCMPTGARRDNASSTGGSAGGR